MQNTCDISDKGLTPEEELDLQSKYGAGAREAFKRWKAFVDAENTRREKEKERRERWEEKKRLMWAKMQFLARNELKCRGGKLYD